MLAVKAQEEEILGATRAPDSGGPAKRGLKSTSRRTSGTAAAGRFRATAKAIGGFKANARRASVAASPEKDGRPRRSEAL